MQGTLSCSGGLTQKSSQVTPLCRASKLSSAQKQTRSEDVCLLLSRMAIPQRERGEDMWQLLRFSGKRHGQRGTSVIIPTSMSSEGAAGRKHGEGKKTTLCQWPKTQSFNRNTSASAHKSLGPKFTSSSEGETPVLLTATWSGSKCKRGCRTTVSVSFTSSLVLELDNYVSYGFNTNTVLSL